jgi:signal transduction histidine kinase
VLSLRNFSRLDEKELKRVDIHEGIDNTLLILQHRLKQQSSRPEIQVIKEYGQLPLVECYASQLNQVFMNLLCNAIDALEEAAGSEPERCGMIRIRTEAIAGSSLKGDRTSLQHPTLMPTGKSHCYPMGSPTQQKPLEEMGDISCVVIHISDNGPGIRAEAKPRLFDPFFTTKPPGKGTGLGLSISYQIVVDKHKGQLLCHSAAGLGTEFVVELPIAQCKSGGNCEA